MVFMFRRELFFPQEISCPGIFETSQNNDIVLTFKMIPLYIPEMTILATRNFLSTNLSFYDQDVYIHIYDHLQLQEREENSCSLAFNFQLVPFLVTRNFSSVFL